MSWVHTLLRRFGPALLVVAAVCSMSGSTVLAGNVLCPPDAPAAIKNSEACKSGSDPIAGNNGLIKKVTNLMAWVVGIAAIIMIIIGGIMYATSGGDSSRISEAKNIVIYSLVGLVVAVLARAIIVFVISRV